MRTLKAFILNKKHFAYISSMVLGLNDALIELTGALAGLTFAFQNAALIAISGLVTGIAAAFSMASAEYLSSKSSGEARAEALRSALYTGITYIVVVLLLVIPYLLLDNVYAALVSTLLVDFIIIFIFSYYLALAQKNSFWSHASDMIFLSLGVAALSFAIGIMARRFLGISI